MNYEGLIAKFFAREISEEEIAVLKKWLEESPENRRIFDKENELCQKAELRTNHYNTDEGWKKLSDNLDPGFNKSKLTIQFSRNNFRILVAAASFATIAVIAGLAHWLAGNKISDPIIIASTIVNTNEGEKAHVILPDSTRIFLNSGSHLEYQADYNVRERNVRLKGEAFFEVHTDSVKPFLVQLGNMSVIATGTRFNVLSYTGEDRIETTLEEGKIKVSIKGQKSINVKSGEQVVYFTRTNRAIVREVSTDTYTSWKENKLRFNDTPFEEALRKIARRYNVTFEVRNSDLLELKYTATFIDESIEDVMLTLKTISPIAYTIHKPATINDKQYQKPKIVVQKRIPSKS